MFTLGDISLQFCIDNCTVNNDAGALTYTPNEQNPQLGLCACFPAAALSVSKLRRVLPHKYTRLTRRLTLLSPQLCVYLGHRKRGGGGGG